MNITKLTVEEISKIQQLQEQNARLHEVAAVVTDEQNKQRNVKKKDELAWRVTPSAELNQLVNHYLMLSKIRLTCKLGCFERGAGGSEKCWWKSVRMDL